MTCYEFRTDLHSSFGIPPVPLFSKVDFLFGWIELTRWWEFTDPFQPFQQPKTGRVLDSEWIPDTRLLRIQVVY